MTKILKKMGAFLLAMTCAVGLLAAVPVATSASTFGANQILKIEDGTKKIDMVYRVWYPDDFSEEKDYKLVVFFHGHGSQGNNGNHAGVATKPFFQKLMKSGKFIIVAPQCPSGYSWVDIPKASNGVWDWFKGANYDFEKTPESAPLIEFMDFIVGEFMPEHNVAKGDLVLTGYSMGGYATWYAATKYTDYVDILLPVCGGNDPDYMVPILKDKIIYTFHTIQDKAVNYQGTVNMVNALEEADANVTYRQYDSSDAADKKLFGNSPNQSSNWEHWAWEPAFNEQDIPLADWLFEQFGITADGKETETDCVAVSYKSLKATERNAILYRSDYQETSDTSNFDQIQNKTHTQNVGFYQYTDDGLKVFYSKDPGYHGYHYAFHVKMHPGTLTEKDVFACLKFKADKATDVTISMKGGGAEPVIELFDGSVAANEWVVTDPIAINVANERGSCLKRLVNNNHNAIGFTTVDTDVNFYVEEIVFFESKTDARAYYKKSAEAVDCFRISYQSLEDTEQNAVLYDSEDLDTSDTQNFRNSRGSHVENVGLYTYEDGALKISYMRGTGYTNANYVFHVKMQEEDVLPLDYKYMAMKVKSTAACDVKIGITTGNSTLTAVAYDGEMEADAWTYTDPIDISGKILNRLNGTVRGTALNHNAIVFKTNVNDTDFYVEEIVFFKTAEEAQSYIG